MRFNRFLMLISLLFTSGLMAETPTQPSALVSLNELTASCIQETLTITDFGDCQKKDQDTCACRESKKILKNICERTTLDAADSCGVRTYANGCVTSAFQTSFTSEVKSVKSKVDELCPASQVKTTPTITAAVNDSDDDNTAVGRALAICKSSVKRAKIMKSCESNSFNKCVCQSYESEHAQACETSIELQVEACSQFRKKDDLMAACLLQHKDILEGQIKKANNRMEKACNINFSKANLDN